MKARNLLLFLLLVSCGYNSTEVPSALSGGGNQQGELNFATVKSAVFEPHCIRCHGSSGGVTLTNYTSVVNSLSRIQGAVNSGAMPPSGSLSQETKNLLNQWIAAGAPETGQGTGGGAVSGSGPGDDCEDDKRLKGANIVVEVGRGRVYDTELGIIRNFRHGCDDDD